MTTTQCDQTLAKIRHFGKVLKAFGHFFVDLLSIWQSYELTLANFYCCKRPDI